MAKLKSCGPFCANMVPAAVQNASRLAVRCWPPDSFSAMEQASGQVWSYPEGSARSAGEEADRSRARAIAVIWLTVTSPQGDPLAGTGEPDGGAPPESRDPRAAARLTAVGPPSVLALSMLSLSIRSTHM